MDMNKPDESLPPEEGAMTSLPTSTSAWQRVGTNTIIGGAVSNPQRDTYLDEMNYTAPLRVPLLLKHGLSPEFRAAQLLCITSVSRYRTEMVCVSYDREADARGEINLVRTVVRGCLYFGGVLVVSLFGPVHELSPIGISCMGFPTCV